MSKTEIKTVATPVVFNEISGFKSFGKPITVAEAIEMSGSNFTVKKEHLLRVSDEEWERFKVGDFSSISLSMDKLVDSHCATVRTDNGRNLGVVSSTYGVVQNAKAFEFVDLIVNGMAGGDENKAIITSCGTLNGGKQMFVSAKLPNSMRIGESDVDDYILFTNSHDGSYSVQVMFTPIRVVCQNTLNMALRTAKNKLLYKHTSKVESRMDWEVKANMDRAIEVLSMHNHFKEEFIGSLSALATKKVSDADVKRFAAAMYLNVPQMAAFEQNGLSLEGISEISSRSRNNVYTLMDVIESGVGQNIDRGSQLWLMNGLTTFISNEKKFKSGDDKFNSIFGGSANKKVQDAFAYLERI